MFHRSCLLGPAGISLNADIAEADVLAGARRGLGVEPGEDADVQGLAGRDSEILGRDSYGCQLFLRQIDALIEGVHIGEVVTEACVDMTTHGRAAGSQDIHCDGCDA